MRKTENCLCYRSLFTSTNFSCPLVLYSSYAAICFNVLNGEKSCRPCGTLRIVFRNVPPPDLRDKLNYLRIQDRKPILTLLLLKIKQNKFCNIFGGLSFSAGLSMSVKPHFNMKNIIFGCNLIVQFPKGIPCLKV